MPPSLCAQAFGQAMSLAVKEDIEQASQRVLRMVVSFIASNLVVCHVILASNVMGHTVQLHWILFTQLYMFTDLD